MASAVCAEHVACMAGDQWDTEAESTERSRCPVGLPAGEFKGCFSLA